MDDARAGPHLVSEPVAPRAESFDPAAIRLGAPPLPRAFDWRGDELVVAEHTRTWTSNKVDRGEAYRDRHWFEFRTPDGRLAVVYFDRHARRGRPSWWLYTIANAAARLTLLPAPTPYRRRHDVAFQGMQPRLACGARFARR